MQLSILSVIYFLFIFLPGPDAWGQSPCTKDFTQISSTCIQSSPFNNISVPIILGSGLAGNVYFYKTAGGQLGKLRVISALSNQEECILYLDAVTFGGEKVYIPNSSLSIGIEKNHWLINTIFLDREGLSAIELHRTDKACALVMTKGTEISLAVQNPGGPIWKSNNYLLYSGAIGLIFLAFFLIARVFMDEQDKFNTQEALEEAENATKSKNQALFLKITRPFYKRYFLPLVQSSKNKQGIRNKYRQKLANGGLSKEMIPEEFIALKLFMILGGPFVFLVVRGIMEETWSFSYIPLVALVGFYYPDIWLSGRIKRRADEILRAMPFIVDMLALSVEAGLDFMAAIQRVIEKAPVSPLVEEFETLIKETKIGSSRAEGLRQMGWRINIIEINSFCATLIAADSVGASIGPILKLLSAELRVKRSSRAETLGAQAATKILIPMIFFILPAVLVAIFAPMVLKMMTGEL
jgi:tight adherence protein C